MNNFFLSDTILYQNKIHSSSGSPLLVLTNARDEKSSTQVNSEHEINCISVNDTVIKDQKCGWISSV